jgi:uncharacterized FlaG/YvyC family protein
MKVNFPAKAGRPYANTETSRNAVSKPRASQSAQSGTETQKAVSVTSPAQDKDSRQKLLEETAELMLAFDRSLRFDVIEEAGILQIKVIDSRDGSVVRKIPADEVVRMVTRFKKELLGETEIRA